MVLKNKRIVIYGMIGLIICGGLVFMGCRHQSPEQTADRIAAKITKTLELDQDQRAQLESIKANIVSKIKEMKAAHEQNRLEIKAQLKADAIDRVKLKQMAADHQEKMRETMDQIIDQVADLYETLSPDQKAKLIEVLEEVHSHRQCRFQ